ncbi:MAG: PAS domain S-box protein [Betaproteobacteria bacterium]|jgi:diguanylate cyclase (GGDEF)-like protein/PAS domain S-box-containing protein
MIQLPVNPMNDAPSMELQRKQDARLRRFLLALLVYGAMALLLFLSSKNGLIVATAAVHGIAAMAVVNILLFLALRSGLNLRARDPSLTWLQMFCASAILLYVFYHFDRERNFALMMCLVVFLFGAFRFNIRQFLSVTVQFLAGLALVMYLLIRFKPATADFNLLALQWTALALVLPFFAFIGGNLTELRQRMRRSNEELNTALADVRGAAWAQRESEARFRNTFDFAAIGMAIVSLDGKWLQVNKALCGLLGYTDAQLKAMTFQDITHPGDLEADLEQVQRILRGDIRDYQMEKRYFRKDGREVSTLLSVSLVRDPDGKPLQFISQIQDITARKAAENALLDSEARFRATFDHASVGIMHSSLDRRILTVNRKFCEMVGYSAGELQQGSVRRIHHPEDSDADQPLEKKLLAGEIDYFTFEKRYIRKDGSVFWANRAVSLVRDANHKPLYFIRVIEDISARKDAEEKLLHLANFDGLTNLPNRAMFHVRLSQALALARRRKETLGVMFLDLDQFKQINDTLGHAAGDLLLKQVAARLTAVVRASDTLGRLSGDEFAVVLMGLRGTDDAILVARKIIEAFGKPFNLEGNERVVTASIGIGMYPQDGDDEATLMRSADAAMYVAKERGRNQFHLSAGRG